MNQLIKKVIISLVLLACCIVTSYSQKNKIKPVSNQVINTLSEEGFTLVDNQENYAFFEYKCSLGKIYMMGIIKTRINTGEESTIFSSEFKSKIPEMTGKEQEQFLQMMNLTAPKGMYYDIIETEEELFLTANYVEYSPLEEIPKASIIRLSKYVVEFACLTDKYVEEIQKELKGNKPFGFAGSGGKESEALKKLKESTKQFQIDIPKIKFPVK